MKRFLRNKRGDDTDASHVVVKWLLLLLLFAVLVAIVMHIVRTNNSLTNLTQCGGVSLGGKIGECKPKSFPCSEGVVGVGCPPKNAPESVVCCFDKEATNVTNNNTNASQIGK
jgi:hypothetical protein